jgi:3-oxoacyl-ACP reductase-like protein
MDGKTALVTGASSGIGRAIAQRFADDGARVCLTGRRKDELEAAAEAAGPAAVAVPCDVSQAADLDRVMDVIRGDGRRLDAVVANAGLGDGSRLQDVPEEPGPIATPAIDRVAGRLGLSSEDFRAALASQLPLQRMGRLGVEGVADEVEVEAVLDGLRLRHGHSEHLAWTRWEVQVPEGMAAGFRWRCGHRRRRRPRP